MSLDPGQLQKKSVTELRLVQGWFKNRPKGRATEAFS